MELLRLKKDCDLIFKYKDLMNVKLLLIIFFEEY